MAAATCARRRRFAVGHRGRVCVLRRRAGLSAAAGRRRPLVQQPRGPVAVDVLGRVVAVRHPVDVRRRARVVRALLSRRHADRGREPTRTRARRSAVDEMGRMAVRRVRADDGVRAAGQRLPVSCRDAPRARRLDARRRRRRPRLRPRQARLVPASLPGQRRVRRALARVTAPLSRSTRPRGARTSRAFPRIRSTARRWCASAG